MPNYYDLTIIQRNQNEIIDLLTTQNELISNGISSICSTIMVLSLIFGIFLWDKIFDQFLGGK